MEDDQNVIVEHPKVEITKPNVDNQQVATKTKLDVVSEGFDNIMKLATEITEIKKMKTQGELILQKMDKDRELLMTEAQAYAEKKNADTKSVVDRMNVIRGMMQDFYAYIIGTKQNPFTYKHDFLVQRVLDEIVGGVRFNGKNID